MNAFSSPAIVVASPAIPPANRFLAAARAAGKPVTTEIRLFVERPLAYDPRTKEA